MNLLKTSLLLCLVVMLAAACNKKPKAAYATVKLDDFFELKLGNSAVIVDNDFKLTLTSVPEDSRCPKFANCIQEGQVKIILSAAVGGKGQTVEMVRKPSDKGAISATVSNFKIQLYEVMPYPENGKKTDPTAYKARLAIRKTGGN